MAAPTLGRANRCFLLRDPQAGPQTVFFPPPFIVDVYQLPGWLPEPYPAGAVGEGSDGLRPQTFPSSCGLLWTTIQALCGGVSFSGFRGRRVANL